MVVARSGEDVGGPARSGYADKWGRVNSSPTVVVAVVLAVVAIIVQFQRPKTNQQLHVPARRVLEKKALARKKERL
jgi:hypothetical protein